MNFKVVVCLRIYAHKWSNHNKSLDGRKGVRKGGWS